MRKMQKKQIMDLVETLYGAHDILNQYLKKNEIDSACQLLIDCQNTAIRLGSIIEESEGEDCAVVEILEKYCEEIYEIYEKLQNDRSSVKLNNIKKSLNKKLIDVKNQIKKNIPVKLEILFLPYKASMWDSLESIWRAADADPNCDAYVMPIAYYDRNIDGSLGKYHYEGYFFPKNIPIISYASYDLDKRKPDVIYIHNPYDAMNFVTSVDPRYYSDELKKHTDCLVYVPYFISHGVNENSGKSNCPAYYNADYIVIQSEKYREYYDLRLPNNKFLPFGSPKIDRVIRFCEDRPNIPDAWQQFIKNKKVYFYNTSIFGMLKDTDLFLKKMDYVFQCFEKYKDSACILWRPHPLLESTFSSMRPHELKRYQSLKRYFVENQLGIYDDTPDVDISIAVSDAYIGDAGSSLVQLFGIAGKPIFILNYSICEYIEREDYRSYFFRRPDRQYTDLKYIIEGGNELYALDNNVYKHICTLDSKKTQYANAVIIDGDVYCTPLKAQDIAVFKNGKLRKIKLKRIEYEGTVGLFYDSIIKDNYIFLIPNKYPAIVRYNTLNGQIDYYNDNINLFMKEVNGERQAGGVCVHGDSLYLSSPTDNQVLEMNIQTGEQKIHAIGLHDCGGAIFVASDGQSLWFMPHDGLMVRSWNPKTNKVEAYNCDIDGIVCTHYITGVQCQKCAFALPAFGIEYVYLSPFCANKYIKINRSTGEVSEYIPPFSLPDKPKNGLYEKVGKANFLRKLDNDQYLCISYFDRNIYEVNFSGNTTKKLDFKIDFSYIEQSYIKFDFYGMHKRYFCVENKWASLEQFLHSSLWGKSNFDKKLQVKSYAEQINNIDGSCGQKVHRAITNALME